LDKKKGSMNIEDWIKRVILLFVVFSSFTFADDNNEWTPAKCHVYGTSIAYRLKDTLQELRFFACQSSVTKAGRNLGWDNNCSNIAILACMSELEGHR
jgi:hypothetical protein